MATAEKTKGGLEDVVATSSAICYLDGERGVLAYCGYDIHDLAKHATFEEVCYLLWHRRLPNRAELGDLQSQMAASRALPEPILRLMRSLPPVDGMDAIRTLTSALAHYDREADDTAPQVQYRKAVRLTAQIGTIVATWGRMQAGGGPIAPDPAMGHAASFLYMLTGERPNPMAIRAFDIALTLHADHELNASTFAGRVAAATLTDIYSAVVAAIGTLKGPLHGGANEEVMHMLNEIGSMDKVESYIKDKLQRKERVMGFGHRVYKAHDPRATYLKTFSKQVAADTGNEKLYDMSRRIEEIMGKEVAAKGIYANVDFYSATTYYSLGLDIDLFTPMFAMSRIAGWAGHCIEQLNDNKLIRPHVEYTGPHNVKYVPIDQR